MKYQVLFSLKNNVKNIQDCSLLQSYWHIKSYATIFACSGGTYSKFGDGLCRLGWFLCYMVL